MVFPSLPIYLDPPNWSQQQHNQEAGIGTQNLQIPPPPLPPPPTTTVEGGGGDYHQGGSIIRPGSMTERARLAKIPQPDAALKCPRCESTNTKFCYYNNYSLLQPRHFCKTCRRYWTRGGALRNVPVGGGCRRNKRSKGKNSSRFKSPTMNSKAKEAATASASANSSSNNSGCANAHHDVISHHQLPFLPNLHHYGGDYVNSGGIGFQIGTSSLNNGGNSMLSSNGISEQWRLTNLQQVQQFPNFLSNLEPPPIGLFQSNKAMDSISTSVSGMPHQQFNTIKMEENIQGLSLSKNLSGNDLFWGGSGNNNAWNEISSFTSSTGHML